MHGNLVLYYALFSMQKVLVLAVDTLILFYNLQIFLNMDHICRQIVFNNKIVHENSCPGSFKSDEDLSLCVLVNISRFISP